MADFVRVTPAEGRVVRDLTGHRIADEGEVLDRSKAPIYWERLVRNGDVTITEATDPAPIAEAAAAPVEE